MGWAPHPSPQQLHFTHWSGDPPQRSWTMLQPTPCTFPFSLLFDSVLSFACPDSFTKSQENVISISKASDFGLPLAFCQQKVGFALRHSAFPTSARVLQDLVEQECLNNCDRWPGLREEITIFLLKFATLPWQGDASLHCLGLPRLRIKSALFFISPLAGSSLWFKSTFHPAWNVHFEGRGFNSLSLKTRQTQKEKESRSMLAVPGSVTWGWQGPSGQGHPLTPTTPQGLELLLNIQVLVL